MVEEGVVWGENYRSSVNKLSFFMDTSGDELDGNLMSTFKF